MPVNILSGTTAKHLSKHELWIICFSNAVASFDFILYLYLADIISATFLPPAFSDNFNNLQVLILLTVGFVARPLGGLIIGRYGDIFGRKPALLFSLGFIALMTFITACLPTYSQIGMTASILFILVRGLQGMAFGAHMPLGWIYAAEHVPKRSLATYSSIITSGLIIGILCAAITYELLNNMLSNSQLSNFGWRITFIIASILSLIALIGWRHLKETPLFIDYKNQSPTPPKLLAINQVTCEPNALFLTALLTLISSSLIILVALLLPDLIQMKFSIDAAYLSFANLIGLIFLIVGCWFFGIIADRIGIAKSLIFGSTAFILQVFVFYYHLMNGTGEFILILYALLGFCAGFVGICPAIFVQLFPTSIRVLSVSFTYNLVTAIAGISLSFGLFYSTQIISLSPALFLTFVGIVALMVGFYFLRSPNLPKLSKYNPEN